MKVMLCATSLHPSYGGPAYSVGRLATALTDAGASVGLFTSDQSTLADTLPDTRANLQYLIGNPASVLAEFGKADVMHDNGLWLPHNHRLAILASEWNIPRVVSPRGMLEPWAINHKALKKRIAWWLYQRRDLQRAALHHATASTEAHNLEKLHLGVPLCVIPNGVDLPPRISRDVVRDDDGWRRALFVGRINPVKGLPMLIEAWSRVRPQNWRLEIVGPDESGHRAEVERAVSSAKLGAVISFCGSLEGRAKSVAFYGAELAIVPSFTESFGMVIAEALAHGLPVLTTTGTPWAGLEQRDCGWWVSPTVEGLARGLQQSTASDYETLRVKGAKGRDWIAADFGWGNIAKRFLKYYEELLP